MENEADPVITINRTPAMSSYLIQDGVQLKSFSSCLQWVCLDQSSIWKTCLSWSIFFVLAIAVPIASHFVLECPNCDSNHQRPYHAVWEISLSVFATISFVCLSRWARKYGVRKFLFLDKLSDASENVKRGYNQQLQRSMVLLCCFVIPSFVIETTYKLWWFISGGTTIPYYGNIYISDTIICTLELLSWLYRTSLFFFVCVIYRLVCFLQMLKLDDFAKVFQKQTEVESILREHLRVRRTLRIISHRFRTFLLSSLILVTASQFISLLITMRTGAKVNIFKAGDLALCSLTLVTGLFICLRSAAKITHKAQSITGLAAKWHICATISSFDEGDNETPRMQIVSSQICPANSDSTSDDEEDEDDLDNAKLMPIYAHTISFQKRQALVTYLENNRAGITVFGFTMDRTWLHTIFGIELALTLWLLNKLIGIS